MNSIFVRIYLGLLVTALVVGLCAWGMASLINDYRAELYREAMARGTFHLLALDLAAHPGSARAPRLQQLSEELGVPLQQLSLSQMAPGYRERLHLQQGWVVFRQRRDEPTELFHALPEPDQVLMARVEQVTEQQARTTAALLQRVLMAEPRQRWAETLAALQPGFGYPLDLASLTDLELDAEQSARLQRGDILLVLDDSGYSADSTLRVLAPLTSAAEPVLVLGPLALFNPMPLPVLLGVGLAGLLALGVTTFLLVRPLQARLRRLDRTVQRLGSGQLDTVAETGPDAIGQLGATFNGMTEHIRRLIESQREMTRAVSHELRTPVARLRFGLEMLADCDDGEERRRKLDELDRDIEQLDHLIDEILTFARLEEGTPTLDIRAVDVQELFRRLLREMAPIQGALTVRDVTDWEALGTARQLEAEERYLHRVLQNLVTNALRYARCEITMMVRRQGDALVLEVGDDGPGIPPRDRERVFKPFARLDQSRHRASGGYGLGLSIVQRIVDWHAGHIDVTDSERGGALFRVTWPLRHDPGRHVLSQRRRGRDR